MIEKKHQFLKGALFGALITFVMLLASFGIFRIIVNITPGLGLSSTFTKEEQQYVLDKLDRMDAIIEDMFLYTDDINRQDLIEGIFAGFISGLGDPYSVYYGEEAATALMESMRGQFAGVGAALSWDPTGTYVEIMRVYEGTPAEAAGLLEGDLLYRVDDVVIVDQELGEIVSMVRGEVGTTVVLHVIREGEVLSLSITRDIVNIQSVDYEMLENAIGYIRISEFDMITFDQFANALQNLQNDDMQGLVVDLRNNPGGNVDTVVSILELLCPKGPLVSMTTGGGDTTVYEGRGIGDFDLPLVVLVNQFSASASEIFAGAIQDYEVGIVLGTNTFGKGVVQQLIDLRDGSILRLTIAEYFTPLGRSINQIGITPDVELAFERNYENPEADNQLEKAIQIILEELR